MRCIARLLPISPFTKPVWDALPEVAERRTLANAVVETLEQRRLLSSAVLNVPALNSSVQSTKQLYLDFDGAPASQWGAYEVPVTPAFDLDGNAASFSTSELQAIESIWRGVAHKFSLFDINVTTVRPPSIEHGVVMEAIVGGRGDWYADAPANGIAYIGSFTSSLPNSAYIFPEKYSDSEFLVSVIAHEAGHGFGLYHRSNFNDDGSLSQEYAYSDDEHSGYIMGGFGGRRQVWTNGQRSPGPLFVQDDLAILGEVLGLLPDREGSSAASAVSLIRSGNALTSGDYANALQSTADVDWYSFDTIGGGVDFEVGGPIASMVDLAVELRDSTGRVVASESYITPEYESLTKRIRTSVPAGRYYLAVRSLGGFGNVGSYQISGTDQLPTRELSRGGAYTASSVSGGRGAANAGDQNVQTRWQSSTGSTQWLQVDLGASATVNSLEWAWAEGYQSLAYKIQISTNGTQWTDLYTHASGWDTGKRELDGLNTTGRYVRLISSQNAGPNGLSLYSFSVFGRSSEAPAVTGSISGVTFNDNNRDGIFNAGDSRAGGKTVFLDANGNGTLDSGERRQVSASDGSYGFTGLDAGTYAVRRVFPNGYGYTGSPINLSLTGGQQVANINIGGNTTTTPAPTPTPTPTPTTSSIRGVVFNDNNRDGVLNAGDSRAGGRTVFLDANANGKLDAGEQSTVSASDGSYVFTALPAGTYSVRRVFPSGYWYTGAPINLTLSTGQSVVGADIGGNTGSAPATSPTNAVGSISGVLFWDGNRNGRRDAGEVRQAGKMVFIDLDGDRVLDRNERRQTTDANGKFIFRDLPAGTYAVRRVLPHQTRTTTPFTRITLGADQPIRSLLIGTTRA